jgi:hypothetical protein
MPSQPKFPTPIQDISLSLIFAVIGESRFNRSYSEYMAFAAKLPPLKDLPLESMRCCGSCTNVMAVAGSGYQNFTDLNQTTKKLLSNHIQRSFRIRQSGPH